MSGESERGRLCGELSNAKGFVDEAAWGSRVARYCSNVVDIAGDSIGARRRGCEGKPRAEKLNGGKGKSVEVWVKINEASRGEC